MTRRTARAPRTVTDAIRPALDAYTERVAAHRLDPAPARLACTCGWTAPPGSTAPRIDLARHLDTVRAAAARDRKEHCLRLARAYRASKLSPIDPAKVTRS